MNDRLAAVEPEARVSFGGPARRRPPRRASRGVVECAAVVASDSTDSDSPDDSDSGASTDSAGRTVRTTVYAGWSSIAATRSRTAPDANIATIRDCDRSRVDMVPPHPHEPRHGHPTVGPESHRRKGLALGRTVEPASRSGKPASPGGGGAETRRRGSESRAADTILGVSAPAPSAARPHVRIGFAGFWDSFDPADNYFTRIMRRRYDVEVCERPDYLIHSCIGRGRNAHRGYDCVRIFYTGENVPADWLSTDWAFTFEYDSHPRHFRLPHWPFYVDPRALVKPVDFDPERIIASKTRFCGFVVSNPLCRTRNEFFRRLSRYKRVDSGGRVMNTLGHRVADKQAFLAECRFTIAFENESHPGYTTEKIAEPMLVNSIPIYWGDPLIGRDFDSRSFLSAHDGGSRTTSALLDELVERVVAIDRNPDLLRSMLQQPWLRANRVPRCVDDTAVLEQFTRIFETPVEPAARRRGIGRMLGLDRLPDAAGSLRRRLRRKIRHWTANA